MALYMETTEITAEKSAGEIHMLLMHAGAEAILMEYKDKKISGFNFKLNINEQSIPFRLPIRIEPIFKYLQKQRDPRNRAKKAERDQEQAERVAWRQLLRWIQAQFAMIDTGMVATAEVFMPYIQLRSGKTLWEHATAEAGRLSLPIPGGTEQ